MESVQRMSPVKRLRLVLLLMAVWDLLGFLVQLYADTFFFEIDGNVDGILAARAFSGALIIPAIIYIYALRDPLRHRAVLWLAVIEQLVAVLTAVFHLAGDTFELESVILPVAVAIAFLILVLLNFPRGADLEQQPARPLETE